MKNKFLFRDLSFAYGAEFILKDLSFPVADGRISCIIGPNGAGKTTLLKILGRLLKFQGKIFLDDREINSIPAPEYARKVGIMFSEIHFTYNFSVKEFLYMARYPYLNPFTGFSALDHQKVEDAVHLAGVEKLYHKHVQELSSGESQLIMIVHLLVQDTEVMLFDEPFAHLDLKNQLQVMALLKKINSARKKTIIIITHNVYNLKSFADNVILLKDKKIFKQGTLKEVLTKQSIEKLYDIR